MGSILKNPELTTRYIPKNKKHEEDLQRMCCHYLDIQYPRAIYRSDLSSGRWETSMYKKNLLRALNSSRAWPDLFIYEPREVVNKEGDKVFYSGVAIELKRDGTTIILTKGPRKGHLTSDPHIQEQFLMLKELARKGYYANFAVGFDEFQKIVDWYFGKPTATALF